jgi:hypothetical protein
MRCFVSKNSTQPAHHILAHVFCGKNHKPSSRREIQYQEKSQKSSINREQHKKVRSSKIRINSLL